jgi:hypothetical protein
MFFPEFPDHALKLQIKKKFYDNKCKSGNSSANQKLKVKSRNLSVNLET